MTTKPGKLPGRYVRFQQSYPQVFAAYDDLGKAVQNSGPLNKREIAIAKLALAVGGRMEGAVHSHCRRALEAGVTPDEIRHIVLLGTTTLGFPSMMATLSWVDDVLEKDHPPD
jgi:4-carboxymuconolactone decarboxylase